MVPRKGSLGREADVGSAVRDRSYKSIPRELDIGRRRGRTTSSLFALGAGGLRLVALKLGARLSPLHPAGEHRCDVVGAAVGVGLVDQVGGRGL